MDANEAYCDCCGGVGVVGDPENKPGLEIKTVDCTSCTGTGVVTASQAIDVETIVPMPEPNYAGSVGAPWLFDFEKMEEYAFARIAADRALRNIPTPAGWELKLALPAAPRPLYDASPRLGIAALYGPEQMEVFARDAVKEDRIACDRDTGKIPQESRKFTGVTFAGWYNQVTVSSSTEHNMERAWDSGRRLLLEGLIGDALDDMRSQFEAYCRSLGKTDHDLERASAHSTRITGDDYTWGDINRSWDSWKAATAASIVKQNGIKSI